MNDPAGRIIRSGLIEIDSVYIRHSIINVWCTVMPWLDCRRDHTGSGEG